MSTAENNPDWTRVSAAFQVLPFNSLRRDPQPDLAFGPL
jgi:hypothetical protein